MNILFAGTPEFAAVHLKAILDTRHQVMAVYTQPDRPAGRGRKMAFSAVKEVALSNDIPVHQPATLSKPDEQALLAEYQPDLMVVVAYGLLLPTKILEIPRYGCINVHASILPRWRGASPIQRAILAGDRETGISIMQMDAGLDTGDVLAIYRCHIEAGDNASILHDRLATLGADALPSILEQIDEQSIKAVPQPDDGVTYAKKLSKDEAQLDWNKPAGSLLNQINAFNPWPVATTCLQSTVLRIWQATVLEEPSPEAPGTVIRTSKLGIDVVTGQGVLRIQKLQRPGAKAMQAHDFLNAGLLHQGDVLE